MSRPANQTSDVFRSTDIIEILGALDYGTAMVRYKGKSNPIKKLFCLKLETFEIQQYPIAASQRKSPQPEEYVNVREIKEVRLGWVSRDFERRDDDLRKVGTDQACCFVILYGSEFKLKMLSLVAQCREERDAWVKALEYVMHSNNFMTHLVVHRWLLREFREMDKNNSGSIAVNDLRRWLQRINARLLVPKSKQLFLDCDVGRTGSLDCNAFERLYNNIVFVKASGDRFMNYCANHQTVTFNEMKQFLLDEQKEPRGSDPQYVAALVRDFISPMNMMSNPMQPSLTLPEFVNFLFSKKNSIFNEDHTVAHQDMDQPLCNYWIDSSHNTYLSGNQYNSESSCECYARVLRMGCRCVELDCWDGPDGQPVITHGRTLCSRIRFLDVIKTIKEHAFYSSDYPVILSIEEHCSVQQQQFMAKQFKEVFGDMLLATPISASANRLPSPNQLKRKIIIKHKKLPEGAAFSVPIIRDPEDHSATELMDLCNSIRNGQLFLQNPINKVWQEHFFVLTPKQLIFTGEQEREESEEVEKVDNGVTPNTELHLKQKWFHGKLKSGRKDAEQLLNSYAGPDGSFLIRESATYPGDYSLSFSHRKIVNHVRIRTRNEGGSTKFFLVDPMGFDSLYDLIEYYQRNPLKAAEFEQVLSEAAPQPDDHKNKHWFHPSLTRTQAEEMLKSVHMDGAFLVRPSDIPKYYAISFRAEGKVKHCRVHEDEQNQFAIGSATFDNLSELISYYEKNPLYRKMKLRYAINDEVLTNLDNISSQDNIYGSIYLQPDEFNRPLKCTARALYEYNAMRQDELTFCQGAIISNVDKVDGGWWCGNYNRQKGWFPANYVEEIPQAQEEKQLGNLQQGAVDIQGCTAVLPSSTTNENGLFILRIVNPGGTSTGGPGMGGALEVASHNWDEINQWKAGIQEAIVNLGEAQIRTARQERRLQIAREMSDLIVYCQSIPFEWENINRGNYYEMSSFVETRAERFMKGKNAAKFIQYSVQQLSRVYPKGSRVDSSNYDPQPMWNSGSQLVALNFQTGDKPMQLNEGKFMQNGRSGYALMPKYMKEPGYDPCNINTINEVEPLAITLTIIGGRHFTRPGRGVAALFVDIEIVGAEYDCCKMKTTTVRDNGFNPVWNEQTQFIVSNPDIAVIRFLVQDEDVFGDPNFLGQGVYPIRSLKPGYRSVQLKNIFSEELELTSLLVHLEIRGAREEDEDLYTSIRQLRDQLQGISSEITQVTTTTQDQNAAAQRLESLSERMQSTQTELKRLTDARLTKTQQHAPKKM